MKKDRQSKSNIQLIWATALILMGVAIFIQTPQKMQQLSDAGQPHDMIWFVRICFYLIGCLLIGGGIKKIVQYLSNKKSDDQERSSRLGDEGSDR